MTLDEQVQVMETQLSNFSTLMDKLIYLSFFFDPDPEFTLEARNLVRSNIAKTIVIPQEQANGTSRD